MEYANGVPGNQLVLFLEAIDENVAEDNPVQSMDAFADSLDSTVPRFKYSEPKETGQTPHNPAGMFKLYI
ncbi:hypothetical protein ES703_51077 [subsurface metagenome]